MPEFDKDLQPVLLRKEESLPNLPNPSTPYPDDSGPIPTFGRLGLPGKKVSALDKLFGNGPVISEMLPTVSVRELSENQRYSTYNPTVIDIESKKAETQSAWDKAANGILKFGAVTGTSILGFGGMLYGAGKSVFSRKLSDIWDNPTTNMLDEINTTLDQKYLPNYYSQKERDAEWYSPDNWMTWNFLFDKVVKNSGYVVGAIATGNMISGATKLAGAALGTRLLSAATAAESSQAFKIFTPLLRNSARAMSIGANAQVETAMLKNVSSIADVTAQASEIEKIIKTAGSFAKLNDQGRRVVTAAFSNSGEASFEALQTGKAFREKLINQYKAENNGREPDEEGLKKIDSEVAKVGKASFFGNMAILGITEYFQLPRLLGSSYAADRAAARSFMRTTSEVVQEAGTYALPKATTTFGKFSRFADRVTGIRRYVFDPKESVQEIMQVGLGVGVQNYYEKAFKTGAADIWSDGFLYGLFGANEQGEKEGALVSKEGLESGLIGGLIGGVAGAKGKSFERTQITTNTQNFINALNSTPSFKQAFQDRLNSANRGLQLIAEREAAVLSNDKLEAMDLNTDMMHNYLSTRIKYGRYDMIMEDLAEFRQLGSTKEGLANLKEQGYANMNDTVESYTNRLSVIEQQAKTINELYDSLDARYSTEVIRDEKGDPVLDSKGRQQLKYSTESIDKMVYAATKIADYERRIPQVNSSLLSSGINTQDVIDSIIRDNAPNGEATVEALNQINELDVTDSVKDELKSNLSDVIELSLRRKLFIEEYNGIIENPFRYETLPGKEFGVEDTTPVPVTQVETDADGKKQEVEKKLEIGKEYSLKQPIYIEDGKLFVAPKIKVLSQTLGGELRVQLPTGKVTYMTPEKFKEYNISDKTNDSEEMNNILNVAIDNVLNMEEYAGIKDEMGELPEDSLRYKLEYINSLINNTSIINDIESEFNSQTEELIRRKEEAERLAKQIARNKEQIEKEQKEIETNSGPTQTGDPTKESLETEEGKRKDAAILFTSSITESEDYNDPTQSAPHVKRSREFLNKVKNFANRANIKAILVTPKQMAKLGLEGLVQMSYGKDSATSLSDIPGVMDNDSGFVAQVFIVQEGGKNYFVDQNGDKLSEVGQQVDLAKVVFQTMPTTNLFTSKNNPKYRSNQEADARAASQAWSKFRQQLFSAPEDAYTVYDFVVSRGVPRTTSVNGVIEKNHVGTTLVPEAKIATQENLILIPTTGNVSHNGELIKVPNGRPVLQYGDTLEFLNNRKFSKSEAKTIFEVIKSMADEVVSQSKAGKDIKFNRIYSRFLQSVLYWKLGSKTLQGSNQIYFDSSNFHFNGKTFSLVDFAQNEKEITELLENTYNNINKDGLTKLFHEPFVEFYFEDGELKDREWKNYQSYLLSSKYPDGKNRSVSDTPLSTNVSPETAELPYTHKQKYSTLTALELPYTKVEAPVITPTAAPVQKIGEYTADGTTPNTITLKEPIGEIKFTTKVENGNVIVEAEGNERTEALAKDGTKAAPYIDALKQLNVFDATKSVEQSIIQFISLNISARLQKTYNEQAPAVQPTAPTPVVTPTPEAPVSDREAKKDDIERRIVELQKRLDEDKYEKEKEDILNSLTKGFLPTGFRFGSSIGIIEKYISEEDRWISVVDNIMALDKDPIKAIDKYFNQQGLGQKIFNANTEYKKQIKPFEEQEEQEDKDITNEQIKLLSTKEGILIRKDWSLGKGLGYTGEGTDGILEIDEDENGNKFEAEYYLTGENDEWIESSYFLGKTKQEVIDKINAKYDAELTALEGTKPKALIFTKYNREDFPDYQPNTRTPATKKLLDYFAEVMGVPKYTEDLSKGEYPTWIESVAKAEGVESLGLDIVKRLNNPKKAFDVIVEHEKERAALEEEEKALEAKSAEVTVTPKVKTEAVVTPVVTPTVDIAAEKKKLEQERDRRIEQEAPIKTLDYPLVPVNRNNWTMDTGKRVSNQKGSEHLDTLEYNALQLARAGVQPLYNGIQSKETLENVKKLPRTDREGMELVDSQENLEAGQEIKIQYFFMTTHVGSPDPSLVALLTSKQIEVIGKGKVSFVEQVDYKQPGLEVERYTDRELKESNALQEKLSPDDWRDRPDMGYVAAIRWAQMKLAGETNRSLKEYLLDTQKEIRDEYQAKIDALEGKSTEPYNPKDTSGPSDDYRLVGVGEEGRMTDAELQLFKEWHAENVPLIPYEVLENMVNAHNGEKAWGVFENGVAKFVRGGLRGTEYHEVFEGIWKMLPEEQRTAILDELRATENDFIDRASGKKLNYATATENQIKERIADDFSDYRLGKLPARTLGEKLRNFFKMIMDFFKSFVGKPTLKEQLFKAIDTGKFKERALPESVKNDAAEYRAVEGLTEQQTHEFVQDMTARAAGILFNEANKKALFSPERITSAELFGKIKAKYAEENKMNALGESRFNQLVKKTKESLRTLGISFNIDDQVDLNDDATNRNDYVADAFKTDWKKSSPFPIKFTLATLLKTVSTNQEGKSAIELPKAEISTVKGYKLVNFSRAFATMLDKLANTTSVSKAVDKLLKLAKADSNYVRLFQRVGGNLTTQTVPFQNFKNEDWRLFIQFMQVFTKQKPQALIQYKTGNEVYTAPANIYDAAKQIQQGWIENIKALAKQPDSFIKYNSSTKTYKVNGDSLKGQPIKTPQNMVDFLSKLGVEFSMDAYNRLKGDQQNKFANAVSSIREYIGKANDVASLTGETIGVSGQFSKLAELLIDVTNPIQDTTYFGVEGKRIQSFSENNATSVFENDFNESETLDELLEKRPELVDVFSANSQVLKKGEMFWDADGNRIKSIKVKYIQGTKNIDKDKGNATSKLNIGDRFTQEINQNLNGDYYVLVPADGSTEWMMSLGNSVSFIDVDGGRAWNKINKIFKGYLMDDVSLALDADNRKQLSNVGNRAKELRFFKDILAEKNLNDINELIEQGAAEEKIREYIDQNIADINAAIKEYIENTVTETRDILVKNKQIVQIKEGQFTYLALDDSFANREKVNKFKMSEDDVNNTLTFANVNYIINNIEFHKILFGDPFQFEIKEKGGKIILDETKRIKSFLSPRRTTFDSPEYNTFLNQNYNKVGEEMLQPGDPGYNEFKPYVNTVTLKDVKVVGSLVNLMEAYGDVNEADAASWITPETYREVKLKNGQWSDEAEAFHQWQMAYTRVKLAEKGAYTYTNKALQKADLQTIKRPSPKYAVEVLKPIVSGVKYNKSKIDNVLDKFSQMPIYYGMVEGKNLEKLYLQMIKSGVGYAIVKSGRKVGAEQLHSMYNADGSFNEEAFNNNIQVPWKAYGIQVENSFVEKEQTRGSQLTKMSSMDLFENGEAMSDDAEKEYRRNKNILDELHRNAYKELLKKLNIVDTGERFEMPDGKSVSEVLMKEMLRRELSDNAKDTIQLDENNQFRIPFEASPSYIQVRNILYSMVDKSIRSPKTGGGAHVQVPVTGFELGKKGLMRKVDGKWTKISQKQYAKLSDEEKKGVVLTDDTLKFYTKENPYCEVMLPHWFRKQLDRANLKTDEEILNYLNSTEEGKKILRGIGFRIPTQALSSAEVFKVKGFLPEYMGYTVVVPSQIVTKAGSDFDIDKLNMYLKSIYIDANGDIRLIEYKGSEDATKQFYSRVYEQTIQKDIDRIERFDEFRNQLVNVFSKMEVLEEVTLDQLKSVLSVEEMKFYNDHAKLLQEIINQASDKEINPSQYISEQIKDLNNVKEEKRAEMLNEKLKEEFVSDMYRRSLENEYYDSLENILTLPENFERLITPVDDAGLKDISDKLDELRGYNESNIKNRILDRNYMTELRHAFITGKKWVGTAAVNITNHSLCQKTKIYIDPERFAALKEFDKLILGNGTVALPHNTVTINGQEYVSLSGRLSRDGKFISDGLSGYATSFVDVAKDPYILKIIGSDLSVRTAMFLQRIGVPLETAAMFMNQPIVKEYLDYLDSIGAKGLFSKNNIGAVRQMFPTTNELIESSSVNLDNLEGNIRDYYATGKLSEARNAEQQVVLSEFLKYAKMAEFNFKFTQALNYDTTKFTSGDTLFKKQTRTATALQTNIISSVDKVLETSFIGEQAKLLDVSMEAMGAILKLEQDQFRVVIDAVLREYSQDEYMSNDDYEKIANKIRASFLDYIIQTKTGLNSEIKSLLVDTSTSVAARIAEAKKSHPEVKILHDFQVTSSDRVNGAKSLRLIANLKDAYDENLYTGYMREMRDNPATRDLYYDVVMLSILQGTYQSAISIKNIIPIEDYSEIVSPIISPLVADMDVQMFAKGYFQRNNWKDENIVPTVMPKFFPTQDFPVGEDVFGNDIFQYFSPAFPNIELFQIMSTDRKVLLLGEKYNLFDVQNDFIKIPRVVEDKKTGERIDMVTGLSVTSATFVQKKAQGDLSLRDVFGYQKVKDEYGNPLVAFYDKDGNATYVYKLVNLYGDGMYASEYNINNTPSEIDNGTVKIANEIPNADIINYYSGKAIVKTPVIAAPVVKTEASTAAPVASIPQNKVSGVESFGSLVTANNEAIKALGPNPRSIDMIEAGFRTRTTRSADEMDKYAVKVGDVVKQFGKSADDTTKEILTRITAIHPKGSPGWKGTWAKEGWRPEDVNVIDRFKDGAAAIEFEVIKPTVAPVSGKIEFDKLPGKSATPTMTYAGIGSRQTPPEILAQMTEVARELSATYTLNTGVTFGGKKEGADKAFDDGATKKNLFSPENQGSRSREQAIAKEIHPNPEALSQGGLRLMARNTNQVFGDNLNTPVDFVLFYAEEVPGSIRPKGGTGQAVEMARRKGIPTINMANPNWRQELDRVLSGSTQPTAAPVSGQREFTPEKLTKANMPVNGIFVFGSNTEGRHGRGAALTAKEQFGAKQGQARGLQGQSYAIVTKDLAKGKRSIPLSDIQQSLVDLMTEIRTNPANSARKFYITKLGSNLAGYTIDEIKGIFERINKNIGIPENVILPQEYEVRVAEELRPTQALVNFDELTEFTDERRQEIVSNFATKHNMTEEQAKNYINQALQKNREEVINKLKECY